MIQAMTRFTFVAGGLLGGFAVTRLVDWQSQLGIPQYYVIFLFIILGGAIGFVFGGIVGRELAGMWSVAEQRMREISPAELLLGAGGLTIGLLVALIASQPLRLIEPTWLAIASSLTLSVTAGYFGLVIALTKRRDFSAMFPRLAPPELVSAEERALVLDTSAIIDARFAELHREGFLPGAIRIPRFVLIELQTLADSADDARRARGRRGLDLLTTLGADVPFQTFEADFPETPLVDEKLMRLCVDAHSLLVTVDFNLTKAARVRGIEVLNLNEAAAALRPNYLPGESLIIRISKPGKEAGQGVGYLEDGTMIVVQEARPLVGEDAEIEVTSVLQTSAGRMIFARLAPAESSPLEEGR